MTTPPPTEDRGTITLTPLQAALAGGGFLLAGCAGLAGAVLVPMVLFGGVLDSLFTDPAVEAARATMETVCEDRGRCDPACRRASRSYFALASGCDPEDRSCIDAAGAMNQVTDALCGVP